MHFIIAIYQILKIHEWKYDKSFVIFYTADMQGNVVFIKLVFVTNLKQLNSMVNEEYSEPDLILIFKVLYQVLFANASTTVGVARESFNF